ncbi:hypothetical protein O6H91_Y124700 [Diphasiastrum complanatum]|nr:hypothetical protein O6H91_Y124700 [Diphasiastrum complanatum]
MEKKWASLKKIKFYKESLIFSDGNLTLFFLPDHEALSASQASIFESSVVLYIGTLSPNPSSIQAFISQFIIPRIKLFINFDFLGNNCFLLHFGLSDDALAILKAYPFRFNNFVISTFCEKIRSKKCLMDQ